MVDDIDAAGAPEPAVVEAPDAEEEEEEPDALPADSDALNAVEDTM